MGIINARKKYKVESAERIDSYIAYVENKKIYIEECRNNEECLLDE